MKLTNCPKQRNSNSPRQDRGIVLVLVMVMLAALMAMTILATQRTTITADHVRRDYNDERVFNVAEGGVNIAERWLRDLLAANPDPTQAQLDAITPPSVSGYTFEEFSIRKDSLMVNVPIMRGPLSLPDSLGQRPLRDIQPYVIRSHVSQDRGNIEKVVEVSVYQVAVQLSQYAMYWNNDLELWPVQSNPSVYYGHIHSNGNIYLGATRSNFDIVGTITAAGHIFNTPKDPSVEDNGTARIADLRGQFHTLSYDWTDPDWVDKSLDDWDGLVQDSSHGIVAAPYPIQTLPNPIELIKRGDPMTDGPDELRLRFRYRAGLKILDGVATDSLNNLIILPAGIITNHSVRDWREGHNMEMRQIWLDSLRIKGYMPANGIIYISYSHQYAAVRLKNGQQLPAGGLVIASENPVYVWGNYNIVNKQRSSIFCDAFNVYSAAWSDANAGGNLNTRNAGDTWIYTCLVAGNSNTDPGYYGGGASSLIRLHERWSQNDQLTYRGSLVCLWESEQATGLFQNASYWEHHRNSGFDPDLLDPEFWPDHSFWNAQVMRASWRSF